MGSWCNGHGQRKASDRYMKAQRRWACEQNGGRFPAEGLRAFIERERPEWLPLCDGLPVQSQAVAS